MVRHTRRIIFFVKKSQNIWWSRFFFVTLYQKQNQKQRDMTVQDKEILLRILDILESAEIDYVCELSAEKDWIQKQLKKIK